MQKKHKTLLQKKLYKRLLTLLYNAHAGHIGSCLSCMDILIETFVFQMKKSDKFILSKGHAAPALYVTLNHIGEISDQLYKTFHKEGTKLPAHPPPELSKRILFPTGSLGHGLSLASGTAHALQYMFAKRKSIPRVFCLMSDGECNEGQVWEAAQYATRHKLHNLVVLVDNNGIQAFGRTEDVLGNSTTPEKWRSFGFDTYEVNGHDMQEIAKVFSVIKKNNTPAPKVLICNTIKGKGVSFMEDTIESHYSVLNEAQYNQALEDIDKQYEK